MRRTIFDHTPDGLRQRLADMERQIADLQRVRNPPASYVEPQDCCGGGSGTTAQLITSAIASRAVTSTGETFFDQTFTVDYSAGRVVIAANEDGTGSFFVDDKIRVDVTHADGSTATYENEIGVTTAEGPLDITSYLEAGSNSVRVRLQDVHGALVSSDALWLVQTFRSISDLDDVDTASPAPSDGDALIFDSATGLWKPSAIGASGASVASVVTRGSAQTIAHDTPTQITFTTEVRDDGGVADLSTHPGRLTAPSSGWYAASGYMYWAVGSSGQRLCVLQTASAVVAQTFQLASGSYFVHQSVAGLMYLAAGDYVQLVVYHDAGANRNVNEARLSLARVG